MLKFRFPLLILFLLSPAAGQAPVPAPTFGRENILPHGRVSSKLLAPGMIVELWGRNLASGVCGPIREPYPLDLCGVHVLIDSRPAELLYVSSYQINLRIPADLPADGFLPIQVCNGTVCSVPVVMQFSSRTAVLSLQRLAYVHMPVWIHVDAPAPYDVPYPCPQWPWGFRGIEFQVRHNGRDLAPLPQPSPPDQAFGGSSDTCFPLLQGVLPLHLLYRFDEPGEYNIRLTARKGTEILYQSDWTPIRIDPFSERQRDEWLRSTEATVQANDVNAVLDVVSSLLAWPDEKALAILLKLIPAETGACAGYGCTISMFSRTALAAFDPALLQREIPRERLRALCPPDGSCR